jgi:hypothetical protein
MPKWILASLLLLISPFYVHALPDLLHQSPGMCEYFLSSEEVRLADLVGAALIEPDGTFLHSPREGVSDHEFQTAKLLAERLKLHVAVLPRLNKWLAIPAVDGIIFDGEGKALRNFSLKTFFPAQGEQNKRLAETLRVARRSLETNYSFNRWQEIMRSHFPRKINDEGCNKECEIYAKIFGLNGQTRPVSIVIDYTLDPRAIFRLHMRKLQDETEPHVFLTLDSQRDGISVTNLMKRMQTHPVIKEYIFIGVHNILSITAKGFSMTEHCDSLAHNH